MHSQHKYKGDNRYLSFRECSCRFNQNKINRIIEYVHIEGKWTHTGLIFQTGVKTSSVHMKFHFGCISKRPDILMDMCRHFISGSVYMIFYHPKWNFISVKMNNMKSIPAVSFKRTCALNVTSNESVLAYSFRYG